MSSKILVANNSNVTTVTEVKENLDKLTQEIIKESKKIVLSHDISIEKFEEVNCISIEGLNKTIIITVSNDDITLKTYKKGDKYKNGNHKYKNLRDVKNKKSILEYIERHYF